MSLSMLSREAQVLLLAAGGGVRRGAKGTNGAGASRNDERLRELLAGPLDWDKLGWLAERERAAPVLWGRLQGVMPGPLPPAAQRLQRLARVSEFRMLHLEQRLAESLEALADVGIDAMLLKGAALAVTAYGSFVQRPMSDLDLLVRESAPDRARDALLGAGWISSDAEQWVEFFRGHHHLPALDDARGTGVQLEIHTALFFVGHPFRLSLDDLWQRATQISVHGQPAYIPSVHDQLLHLCLHFAWSHMMGTGAWRAFRDLETLLASGQVRWQEFIELARESRGASCCYWTFRLANRLAGVEVPPFVIQALQPPATAFVLDRVERHFTYHLLPTEALCPSVSMAYAMWRLGVRPGWSGHGAVRPWDRTDDLLVAEQSRPRRLADQIRNVRGWARYVRSIMMSTE